MGSFHIVRLALITTAEDPRLPDSRLLRIDEPFAAMGIDIMKDLPGYQRLPSAVILNDLRFSDNYAVLNSWG